MRISSIYLQEYHVLKQFSLSFEHASESLEGFGTSQYALDLIVGVNGTGKSSLLRAIAEIFRRLDDPYGLDDFPFGFAITYQVTQGSPVICLTNLDIRPSEITEGTYKQRLSEGIWRIGKGENAENISLKDVTSDKWPQELQSDELPPLIVAFTTGSEKEWELSKGPVDESQDENGVILPPPSEQTPEQLTNWFLGEVPGEPVVESSEQTSLAEFPLHTDHFLFIKERFFPLVILCSLLADMVESDQPQKKSRLQKVLGACNIKALHGFSLKFRMNKDVLKSRDKEFVRDLAVFAKHYTLQSGSDYLLIFDLETLRPDLRDFLSRQGGGLELFRTLVRLYEPENGTPPILHEVNLFLEREHAVESASAEGEVKEQQILPPLHLLSWLSDGERSFLGRLCLLSLLGSSKSGALILIDEPEVHFNDYWKRHLVSMIDSALYQQDSHVLMTTHSSITLSDVTSRDIWILRRDGDYTNQAVRPGVRTLGADPSDIMVYIFEAENAVGAQGEAYIERKLMEIAHITGEAPERVAEKKRTALNALLQEVGPGEWSFLIRRDLNAL
jgi:predicted ATPase